MKVWPMLAYSYLRFSFSEQAKGDSIRRQVAARDAYLARKGLSLDTSFVLPPDRGKSAFSGAHRTTGNLRLFLDACDRGRIRKGSYLIVENLDRLSREEAGEALDLFRSILGHGITIVTLTPEMEFTPGAMDFGRWVIALAEMCRGHSESLAKSVRAKANWENLRAKIDRGPITLRRPAWLDVECPDPLRFKLHPKKAATVRLIFKLAAEGYGTSAIAKRLNREKVPVISKATHWFDSYVYRIVTNRATVGEYQPHKRDENRKLVPVGQPVKDYFPAVVTEDKFSKAQVAIRSRRTCPGRTTGEVRNLFTTLVVTPDGIPCALRNRNYHDYLIQNTVAAGITKSVNGVPYQIFEKVVLRWLREVKIDLTGDDPTEGLKLRKTDLEETIKELEAGIKKGGKSVGRLIAILEEKETELGEVEESLQLAAIPRDNQLAHTRHLIDILADCPKDERESVRRQIKQQIRFLVEKIIVATEGKPRDPNKTHFLTLRFRDGAARHVWFRTNKWGLVSQGLWSPDGRFPLADMDHQLLGGLQDLLAAGVNEVPDFDLDGNPTGRKVRVKDMIDGVHRMKSGAKS